MLLREVLKPKVERVAALDASFIRKSGKFTAEIDYFHSGSSGRVKRDLEMSLLSVIDLHRNTGFSLLARQAKMSSKSGNRIDQALTQIESCQAQLDQLKIKDVVVDAWYSKERFVSGVNNLGLTVVGKLQEDARLHFKAKPHFGRVRPRKYGQRLKTTDLRRLKKQRCPTNHSTHIVACCILSNLSA